MAVLDIIPRREFVRRRSTQIDIRVELFGSRHQLKSILWHAGGEASRWFWLLHQRRRQGDLVDFDALRFTGEVRWKFNSNGVTQSYSDREEGYSVRCILDAE